MTIPLPLSNFMALINYLFAIGRKPTVDYISYNRRWNAPTAEELHESIINTFKPENDKAKDALNDFLLKNTVFDSDANIYMLDYDQEVVWGYVSWKTVNEYK